MACEGEPMNKELARGLTDKLGGLCREVLGPAGLTDKELLDSLSTFVDDLEIELTAYPELKHEETHEVPLPPRGSEHVVVRFAQGSYRPPRLEEMEDQQ